MTENPDGSLTIAPGEVVTVVVTKQFVPFAATFTPLIGASWNGVVASPDGLSESNSFVAPPSGASISGTIMYDFRPDGTGNTPAGDNYQQVVTGNAGGPAVTTTIFPPGISSQTLSFDVEKTL